ncbi:hypothetical protein BGX34_002852 [Mortierella sp. NVP85]|nr:hypothetical protein BGX34_002852 [Mortierella sp. NVP85]
MSASTCHQVSNNRGLVVLENNELNAIKTIMNRIQRVLASNGHAKGKKRKISLFNKSTEGSLTASQY